MIEKQKKLTTDKMERLNLESHSSIRKQKQRFEDLSAAKTSKHLSSHTPQTEKRLPTKTPIKSYKNVKEQISSKKHAIRSATKTYLSAIRDSSNCNSDLNPVSPNENLPLSIPSTLNNSKRRKTRKERG